MYSKLDFQKKERRERIGHMFICKKALIRLEFNQEIHKGRTLLKRIIQSHEPKVQPSEVQP